MKQSDNDLAQLEQVVKDLSNVYKTQCTDDIMDNGNLTELNNAILNVKNVIRWLKKQQPKT